MTPKSGGPGGPSTAEELLAAGAASVLMRDVAAEPAAVDAALTELDDRRLVIEAGLADLNLVLHRLMRAGRLGEVDTAVLTGEPIGYLGSQGLARRRDRQIRAAVRAATRLVGVIKDDSGGLCVDGAELSAWPSTPDPPGLGASETPVPPEAWWVRAVVDDQRLCDGPARRILLHRTAPDELSATVRLGRRPVLLDRRTCRGRSLQLACGPALITADSVARDQPRSKRTFWSEPDLWKLAVDV